MKVECEYVEDKCMKGSIFFANGERYEGDIKNARAKGQGTMTFLDGSVYTGAWNKGKQHGQGKYTSENMEYSGEWLNNKYTRKG